MINVKFITQKNLSYKLNNSVVKWLRYKDDEA